MHVRIMSDCKSPVGVNACVCLDMTILWLTSNLSGVYSGATLRAVMDNGRIQMKWRRFERTYAWSEVYAPTLR